MVRGEELITFQEVGGQWRRRRSILSLLLPASHFGGRDSHEGSALILFGVLGVRLSDQGSYLDPETPTLGIEFPFPGSLTSTFLATGVSSFGH